MNTQKTLSATAWGELLLLGLIWGGSFLATRVVLDEVPVVTTVLHRTGWASLVLCAFVAAQRLPLPRNPRIWGAFFIMGLLNNVIPFGLMTWGQLYIESGLTSILNATTAIFGVIVAAMVFRDERLTLGKTIGVTLGFFGVVMAIGLSNLTSFDLRSTAQIAVLGGTLSYALAASWARRQLSGVPPQVAAAGMLCGSTLILLPTALIIDGPISLDLGLRTWGAIAYLTLIATAGAYLLYYRVLAMAGSGNLMLVTLVIPPVAIVLGALVLDEALKPQAFGGFALLTLGLLILNNAGRRQRN
jgi:drug/metabolite transporter (DMT)-like permease